MRRMSWKDARGLGDAWADKHLPPDLKGRLVQFANFDSEDTCRFFHPDWSVQFKEMVVSAAARAARKRGAKTCYLNVTLQDYRDWLKSSKDSPEQRRAFLDTVETVIA